MSLGLTHNYEKLSILTVRSAHPTKNFSKQLLMGLGPTR